MIVNVNNEWRLRSDPYQWIIERKRKHGKRWDAIAYTGDLGRACLLLAERHVRGLDLELPPGALIPLLHAVADLKADIRRGLGQLNSED